MQIINMSQASPFEKLLLLLIGPEKGGKSRLAATARKPVLFLDYDFRKEAIARLPGVFAVSEELQDPAWPQQPTAYQKTLNIIGELEQHKIDLGDPSGPLYPKTLVFDSVATFAKRAGAYALFTTPDIRRTINVAGMQFHMPKGFDGWNAEMSLVESAITRACAIKDLDVIAILHEQPEEAPESSNEHPSYTGKIAVYPTRYKLLLKYFNEVWRVTRENNLPDVQIVPNYKFTAATNLGLTSLVDLDIEKSINARK
jgi:hypothetical protein